MKTNTLMTLLILLIISVATVTTYWAYHNKKVILKLDESLPDSYMEDVTATVMDKYGKVKMKITTPKLIHYNTNDKTELTTPQFIIFKDTINPWYVNSKLGIATNGNEIIDLIDDVVLHHAEDETTPATLIKTPTLRIKPNDNTAQTKDKIIMTQPNLRVKGVGMFANMDTGDVKLLAKTRGEYVPTTSSG